MDSTAVTVIVSAVLTVMAQIYREGRQRRWDQEDRARLAGDLATKVEAQRAFLDAFNDAGGYSAYAVGVDRAIEVLKQWELIR